MKASLGGRVALVGIAAACATSPRATTNATSSATASGSIAGATMAGGEDVVRGMYQRYAGKWYRALTFRQKTTTFDTAGTPTVTYWFESALPPGRLRIDIEPFAEGRAYLWARDSIFVFRHDSLLQAAPNINPLLLLGFDVYAQPAEVTIAKLRGEGFDFAKVHDDTWEGRPVTVVGAAAGDARTKQFWVDKERLLFVRLLETSPRGDVTDFRFENYRPLGGGWIAPKVTGLRNGKPFQLEEYSEVNGLATVDPSYFDPRAFSHRK
ncbi:MAG: hypothetical protein ABJD07_06300 [Gemmatimonadaceae bacterium]